MKCPKCGKNHDIKHPHFQEEGKLIDEGFPTHSKGYRKAHRAANKAEKKEFGEESFNALNKIAKRMGKHELEGKNLRSGKIEVSDKVPARFRPEVAFHERFENRLLRRKNG